MDPWYLWYAVTGILAGLLAGLMGVGGGLVIVPSLLFAFALQGLESRYLAHLAVGTSLAAIVPISVSSLWAHHRRGAVEWSLVLLLAPGLMLGAWSGAWLADQMSTPWLKRLFGAFLLLVALQMVSGFQPPPGGRHPGRWLFAVTGWLIGGVSGLVGIGGGTMTVPFLVWQGYPLPRAVATSAACGLPIALAGAAGFIFFGADVQISGAAGYVHWSAMVVIALFAVVMAPLGARLAHTLPVAVLRRLFAAVLAIVGSRLLLG